MDNKINKRKEGWGEGQARGKEVVQQGEALSLLQLYTRQSIVGTITYKAHYYGTDSVSASTYLDFDNFFKAEAEYRLIRIRRQPFLKKLPSTQPSSASPLLLLLFSFYIYTFSHLTRAFSLLYPFSSFQLHSLQQAHSFIPAAGLTPDACMSIRTTVSTSK